MKLFKLPDLGEGLPDAQIREWYIKEGDTVAMDQPLVAMETAKALVDVPAPYAGVIEKLFGAVNDTINTGDPLIGFVDATATADTERKDTGTVVGNIEVSDTVIADDTFSVGMAGSHDAATPAARALARSRGVDLNNIHTQDGHVHVADVKNASKTTTKLAEGFEPLSAVRRAMILSMEKSHQEVVPVTITDDADIHAWYGKDNITIRIIRAIAQACAAEPMLNASFDGKHMAYKLNPAINIGLAVDTKHGLYVPVIHDAANKSDADIRALINQYKQQAETKSIAKDALHGATIILSNFGTIAGRYATPILLPPMTAIVGIGKLRDEVVAFKGEIVIHKVLPISLSVDHRAITGGEAARFLSGLITNLSGSADHAE